MNVKKQQQKATQTLFIYTYITYEMMMSSLTQILIKNKNKKEKAKLVVKCLDHFVDSKNMCYLLYNIKWSRIGKLKRTKKLQIDLLIWSFESHKAYQV